MTRAQIDVLLREAGVLHLAVVEEDGSPYISPLSFVFRPGEIMFRTFEGRRTRALLENPNVCFEVSTYDDNSGDWRSAIGFGKAEIVSDDDIEEAVIAQLLEKYDKPFRRLFGVPADAPVEPGQIVRVPIESVEGRRSGGFFDPRTRPGRL